IDRGNGGEQDLDVLLFAQNPADRRGDVAGRQRRGRHLIEQRLKEMIVVAIEQRHAHVGATKGARCVEAAEAAADDDHTRSRLRGGCVRRSEFGVQGSRSLVLSSWFFGSLVLLVRVFSFFGLPPPPPPPAPP